MSRRDKGNQPGDVVLVNVGDQLAGYARLEAIRGHGRPGWHECDLLFLGKPLQPVTWILERAQIDGASFTMGGRPIRIEGLPALGVLHDAIKEPPPGATEESSQGVAGESAQGAGEPSLEATEAPPQDATEEKPMGASGSRESTRRQRRARVVPLVPRGKKTT